MVTEEARRCGSGEPVAEEHSGGSVGAYTLELSLVRARQADPDYEWVLRRDELVRRLGSLPADHFPHTRAHAAELTSGNGHERFDFTLELMLDSLTRRSPGG